MSDLTEKQRRFVEAYMGEASGNATEAARLAGYSDETENALASAGSRLLRNVKIRDAIKARVVNDPLVADRREWQQFWTDVMRGDVSDGEEPASVRDRMKAAELLAKSQGGFTEKVDVTSGGKTLNSGFMSRDEARAVIAAMKADTDDADG